MERSVSTRPLVPEVRTLDPGRLDRLRWLGELLDNSIPVPGTNFRFGIDTIIGLVPGVGDLVGRVRVRDNGELGAPEPVAGVRSRGPNPVA